MRASRWLGAASILSATVLARLASFAFSVRVAHLLGEAGVGVYASVTTLGLVIGDVASLGLPLWALYACSRRRASAEPLAAAELAGPHGLAWAGTLVAFTALFFAAPLVGGGPALHGLARAMTVGMAASAAAAFVLAAERGYGRAAPTVASHVVLSAALGAGLLAESGGGLELAFAGGGLGVLVVALARMARDRALRPSLPRAAAASVRAAAPFLTATVLGLLLFSLDMLVATALESPEARGRLQIATAVTRALASAQAHVAAVLLHRVERAQVEGRRAWLPFGLGALAAGAALAGVAALMLPWIAALFRVPLERVAAPAYVSFAVLPLAMAAMTLLTLGLQIARRAALASMAAAAAAQALLALALRPALGLVAYPIAVGASSLVVLAVNAAASERARGRRAQP